MKIKFQKTKLLILTSLLLPALAFGAPTISITNYSNLKLSDSTTITPNITEPSNIGGVIYKIDDIVEATVTTSPFALTLNTTKLSNGPHKITAILQSNPATESSTWVFVWNSSATSANANTTKISNKIKIGDIPYIDSQITMVTQGLKKFFYITFAGAQLNYRWDKYEGTLAKPFTKLIWRKIGYQVLNGQRPLVDKPYDHYWMLNTYQNKNEVLGFIHVEQRIDSDPSYFRGRIALTYSSDYGNTWKNLGYIIVPKFEDESNNPLGAPYFVKDGYIYVYYGEASKTGAGTFARATTVARANLNEVMIAARLGKNVEWKKYFEGAWNEPGISGSASPIIPLTEGHNHTDAAYSTHTGKMYIMTTSSANYSRNTPSQIKLFESSDGIHWKLLKIIDSTNAKNITSYQGFHYVSIVDIAGTDSGVVGRYFYILAPVFPAVDNNFPIYRWTVDLGTNQVPPPTLPPATTTASTTISIEPHISGQEFSSTQGNNGWFYQYRGTGNYINMLWDTVNNRWKGNEQYAVVQPAGMHPGVNVSVSKTWKAMTGNQIKLIGKVMDSNSNCGNGVIAKIFKNNSLLWQRTITNGDSTGASYSLNTNVVAGDKIYHEVFANNENSCDSTGWNPEVDIIKTN